MREEGRRENGDFRVLCSIMVGNLCSLFPKGIRRHA